MKRSFILFRIQLAFFSNNRNFSAILITRFSRFAPEDPRRRSSKKTAEYNEARLYSLVRLSNPFFT